MTDSAWSQVLLFFTWLPFAALHICSFKKKVQKIRLFFSFNPLQCGETSKRCGRWAGGMRTVFPSHAQWAHKAVADCSPCTPLLWAFHSGSSPKKEVICPWSCPQQNIRRTGPALGIEIDLTMVQPHIEYQMWILSLEGMHVLWTGLRW